MFRNRHGRSVRRPELHTPRWRRLRRDMLVACKFTCQKCGDVTARRLELHHRKPVSQGGDLWDPDNLLIVCLNCHVESHQNLDKEQIEWRRYVRSLV